MKLKGIVEHRLFSTGIMLLILVNAICIGLETYPELHSTYQDLFIIVDRVILTLFCIEIALKLVVYKGNYFKSGWNVMDFSIVVLSLLFINTSFVSILRIIRVLRILRTISVFPSLRRLVNALFMSIPALGSTFLLMVIVFYIYAIIGTTFFAEVTPEYFGSLELALLALFQVFTLESWASAIFRPIFLEFGWSWIYFSSFIIISAFIVANIFFGEIVNNAQKISQEMEVDNKELVNELEGIQEELANVRESNKQLQEKMNQLMNALLQKQKG